MPTIFICQYLIRKNLKMEKHNTLTTEEAAAKMIEHFTTLKMALATCYIAASLVLITLWTNFFYMNALPKDPSIEALFLKSFSLYSSTVVLLSIGFFIKYIREKAKRNESLKK